MRTPISQPRPPSAVTPLAYSVEDAARALGIGRSLAFELIRDKKLVSVKIKRRTVVTVEECEAFLARQSGVA